MHPTHFVLAFGNDGAVLTHLGQLEPLHFRIWNDVYSIQLWIALEGNQHDFVCNDD
jgi:hypothetical protein